MKRTPALLGKVDAWVFGALVLAGALGVLKVLRDIYLGLQFGFYDFTLINDALANTLRHGQPFLVSNLGVNHLAWHFTPTLFVLTPLYAVVDSQFVLAVWNVAAMASAVVIYGLILVKVMQPRVDLVEMRMSIVLFGALVWNNTYVWNIVTAGHFEVLYAPIAGALVLALISEAKTWVIVLLSALAIGVREDAGFFLAFLVIALHIGLIGRSEGLPRLRRRTLAIAGAGVGATLAIAKVVFPALGTNETWHAQRLWAHYGDSFEKVAMGMLASPSRVWADVVDSAALSFNQSFLFVNLVSPIAGLVANIPGALFFTTDSVERKHLYWYNSSFLICGFLLCFVLGLRALKELHIRVESRYAPARHLYKAALFCLTAVALVVPNRGASATRPSVNRSVHVEAQKRLDFMRTLLASCAEAKGVATDFASVTLLPNGVHKYLFNNYEKADAVIVFEGANLIDSKHQSIETLRTSFDTDESLRLATKDSWVSVYFRVGLNCTPAVSALESDAS